ncbi:MAG: 1-acyl-sn-glycerol-3-phosphate acyltransferase [SAR86 cluster bacterium]|uniref:1-acyl-sn-glycerol-3-phosphate acyltransferase n=1 Tax=SAR86 cluster bacterium TaxID=2030880 RepID=A0A937I928_9GAMM|nr:1-acyl-sn-glycerol-3-phosphate acyltransferase [SAR86 cluster bacterium]
MYLIKSSLIGFITLIFIIIELTIGFGTLAIVNVPRAIFPFKSLKIKLANISNNIGEYTVYGLKIIMKIMHRDSMQVFDNNEFDKNAWYMAISNHQSWADIFILLVAAHRRIPLLKFFMKKELAWIPFIFLANKTLNMPFVKRHSKKELEKNPNLRNKDYENTLKSCKRFLRSPSTIFSYAEGTRNDATKHKAQNSPYKNLLKPRIGGIATALSAMPNINVLVDYSVVYKSEKRGAWSFLKGDMKDVKVLVRKYDIPENLKNKNYSTDTEYRENFKNWIEAIWIEKDQEIERLKF